MSSLMTTTSTLGPMTHPEARPGRPALLRERRTVLLVEDEVGIRTALTMHFTREGWQVTPAGSVREALLRLAQEQFNLVLSDVRLPDGLGTELLPEVRSACARTPVIFLTAFGTMPDAVGAIQAGASDYLAKPVVWAQLWALVERLTDGQVQIDEDEYAAVAPVHHAVGSVARHASVRAAVAGQAEWKPESGIVGRAPALLEALARARAAARTDADVLVEAESGTGKELLARFVHEASDRAQQPFIAVNCAAVPEHLLESELFGHERGAFTGAAQARPGKFELAHGGTLLLDEIGEMPLHLQPKLLRALQEREFERLGGTRTIKVDIRVIATTNVALAAAVDRGVFRSDLYYRLNVIPLSLPALRDRVEDVPHLAEFFARCWAARAGLSVPALTDEFLALLAARAWPGNVRELGNVMRRVLALNPAGQPIDAASFRFACGEELRRTVPGTAAYARAAAASTEPAAGPALERALDKPTDSAAGPIGMPIRQLERLHLEKTLALTQGNRTHAAEMLGISLRTMRNRIREYGLPPRRYA